MTSYGNYSVREMDAVIDDDFIKELVESLGGEFYREDADHLWFSTICHGGDSHKLCYNRDTKVFYCYSNCGAMNVPKFVATTLNISYQEGAARLRDLLRPRLRRGIGTKLPDNIVSDELEALKALRELKRETHKDPFHFKAYSPFVLDCFENNVFYEGWTDEGISIETMQDFGIRWDEITHSIIIPHYNIHGELIGIRTRQIDAVKAKYMPLKYGGVFYNHPLGMNLYGIHLHKESIQRFRQVIITEAEKSVMKHHTWYGGESTAVAVCGFHVSTEQRDTLLKLGVEEVILAFDNDVLMNISEEEITDEYERYCNKVNQIAKLFAPYCNVSVLVDNFCLLGLKDSPMDKDKETFEQLMRQRQFVY